MPTIDRVAAVLALAVFLGSYGLQRALLWADPAADNYLRFHQFAGGQPGQGIAADQVSAWSWTGADEVAAPAGFPGQPGSPLTPTPPIDATVEFTSTVGAAGSEPVLWASKSALYRSSSSLPRDRWGSRWHLVVAYTQLGNARRTSQVSVYSPGPNGVFEQGAGDDMSVTSGGSWPSMGFLRALVVIALIFYLAVRVSSLPRRDRLWKEVALSGVIAIPFIWLASTFGWVSGHVVGDPFATAWSLFSPENSGALAGAAVAWGLIFLRRIRRPLPGEADADDDVAQVT